MNVSLHEQEKGQKLKVSGLSSLQAMAKQNAMVLEELLNGWCENQVFKDLFKIKYSLQLPFSVL